MKYIRTKGGHIFEIVDYEQLDENTKKNIRQSRYIGLEDYLNEKIFVKIHKNMPNPISQYQSIKMFDILKQADTIEELCDAYVLVNSDKEIAPTFFTSKIPLQHGYKINEDYVIFGAIWTDKGLIYVAKMNDKGELELL